MSKKPRSRSTDDADDSKEELQETDWRVGWYSATVHSYVNHNLFGQIRRIVTLNNKQKKLSYSGHLI